MVVLTLSVYHPILRNQIPLTTIDCESENKESTESFWKTWIEALRNWSINPIGIIIDENVVTGMQ